MAVCLVMENVDGPVDVVHLLDVPVCTAKVVEEVVLHIVISDPAFGLFPG